MEPPDRPSDSFDALISEAVRERLGAVPSADVWERIAHEVQRPPHVPPWVRLLAWLHTLGRSPLTQSAVALAMTVLIFVQPAYYWMHQDIPQPVYSAPIQVPPLLKGRALPDGETQLARSLVMAPPEMNEEAPPLAVEARTIGGPQP